MARETVRGLQKLITTIKKVPKELEQDVGSITEANAQEIEAEAKRLVPVDTAKLQQSIKVIKLGPLTFSIMANATGLAPYAVHVEFGKPVGTGPNGGPRPFLFPAFFKQRKVFIQDIENLMDNTFGKI